MPEESDAIPPSRPYAVGGGMFPSTQWPLVRQAGGSRATQSREALDELVRLYRPALMKYLRYVCRVNQDHAEDLLQGFLAEKVVRNRLIAHADQRKGRFRTYLKTVLNNYVRSEIRRSSAQKRAPDRAVTASSLDDVETTGSTATPQPDVFDVEWGRTLLQQALDRFRSECMETDREDLWEIFSARLLRQMLENEEPVPYDQLVARMGFSSPSQVWNALNTAKLKLAQHLKDLIAPYARDEQELEEEINDLFEILSRAG